MHDRSAVSSTDTATLARIRPSTESAARESAPARDDTTADTMKNVRASGLVIAIAFLLMACFDSSELRSFTRDLPESRLSDILVLGADWWHSLMETLGLAELQPAIRDLFDRLRETGW